VISTTRAATVRPSTGAGAVAGYALGHAAEEQRRLDNQGAMIRPQTERLLREAGLGPGMRVLDAGCGTGDVTLQVAELVGPRGMVVGVDRSAEALATAGERVAARGLGQVGFVQEDVAAMTAARPFDAVVGRLLLMHQPEPAAVLRHLAGLVRPGGTVAFLEFALVPILAVPARPLYERAYGWVLGALTRAGIQVDLGLHLDAVFAAAGLPAPAVRIESMVFAGADPGLGLLAETVRTLVPAIERFGLATAAEVGIDTLLDRLLAEGAAIGGAAWAPAVGAAWVRLPAA
jgi:SAM-dependent methyltransferase